MGNYKFKLSNMMPNAWFYKLRDMNRAKRESKHSNIKPYFSHPRRPIYHTTEPIRAYKFFNSSTNLKFSDTHFTDFSRNSSTKRSKRKTIYKPSPRISTSPVSKNNEKARPPDCIFSSSEISDNEFYDSPFSETEPCSIDGRDLSNEFAPWSSSCSCRVTSSTTDIIIDVSEKSSISKQIENLNELDLFSDIQLPPIVTKHAKFKNGNQNSRKQLRQEQSILSFKIVKECSVKTFKQRKIGPGFRKSVSSPLVKKLKSNSPKIASKKIQTCPRKSMSSWKQSYKGSEKKRFSKSFVMVKSSYDPERDFMNSMVEMIVENDLSASKDLEELLAYYLSLNSEKYHDVIVKVFEQIWFDMARLRL